MENIEYIKDTLQKKGINQETIGYVLQYIDINRNLFGNSLDIDKLTERILSNLKYDIRSFEKNENIVIRVAKLFMLRGVWEPNKGKISINPIVKAMSIFSKKARIRNTSTIMHELDHCATTEYINISQNEKEEYIQSYLNNHRYSPKMKQRISSSIDSMYNKVSGKLPVLGIFDSRYKLGHGINLRALNEGITAYKQGMYDEYLGNRAHTGYKIEKDVASFIADIIGKEQLISRHFNNDYDAIRQLFNEKTGKDLNDLVKKLNHKSHLKTVIFGRFYTKKFSRDIHKYMESFRGEQGTELTGRNTDFVPKYEIDHSRAIKDMKEHGINRQQDIEQQAI